MIYKRKYNSGGLISYQYGDTGASRGAPSSGSSTKDNSDKDLLYKEFLKGDMLSNEVAVFQEEWKKIEQSSLNPYLNSSNVDKSIDLAGNLVKLKNNKKLWNKAYQTSKTSGGLKEIAVGDQGELFVRTEGGQITSMSINEYKKNSGKVKALSVAELLEERESNPSLVGQNSIFTVANNSIGIERITTYAQNIISKIGTEKKSSERVYDRDTVMAMRERIQEELQAGRVPTDDEVKGFAILDSLVSSSSPHNLVKEETSTQKNHVMKAVNYIWTTLDRGARNKLSAQAALTGQEPTQLLLDLVQMSTNHSERSSIKPISEAKATTGSDATGTSSRGKHMNNPQMMIDGTLSTGKSFEFNDPDAGSKFSGLIIGTSALTTPKGEAIPATTLNNVLATGWNQVVDINNIFFGNKKVDRTQLAEIAVDGMSEMGNVYLPVNPNTGGPDNGSLNLFRSVMEEYEKIKDDPNISDKDIEVMFDSVGFDVTIMPDKSLDVKARSANVKPFWVTFAYTNDASDLVKDNNDPSVGGLRKLSKDEHNRITPITDEAFIKYQRDGTPINIRPNRRFKSEKTYRGIVAIPLREGATANIDALVGSGPEKPVYSSGEVRYNAQNTSGKPFRATSAQQLNRE